jgi:hypothetical protein
MSVRKKRGLRHEGLTGWAYLRGIGQTTKLAIEFEDGVQDLGNDAE